MTQWGLDVLFNPSKRHMDEEKRRLQATRPVIGDASGGNRIDLESGKVRIKSKRSPAAADNADDEADIADAAADADEADEESESESGDNPDLTVNAADEPSAGVDRTDGDRTAV